jgi:CheY-like chemotaxis protein
VRVLLVDDDRLSRTTIVKMLEHSHTAVSVDEASDGTEALQRYRECGPYDIVLTDYAHPGLNGYLLADAIRKANPAQSIACLTGDIETGEKCGRGSRFLRSRSHSRLGSLRKSWSSRQC